MVDHEPIEVPELDDLDDVDEKWHGVPPAGERPPRSRWRTLIEITAVLFIEFVIWGIYRYATAPIYGQFGTFWFYVGHMVAAPTIHLIPIFVYWKFVRKERLFYKTDLEDGKYTAVVIGPIKLTRKFLLTAFLVGLFGGIVWRVAEMMVSDAASIVLGGSKFGSVTLFDLFIPDEFGLFLLMTFVMFFVVGPVEEFEFRSFTHDQAQRVLPKWAALAFSSVFFGFSHIPIALFIYKYNLTELIFAEISWMTAGAVFGALYMWSRNIFACIVMHGIGNWQLSVFLWQSKTVGPGLTDGEYFVVSLITSIAANAFMIAVFYLVHRLYWEPQRRGELAFGGKLGMVQRYLYSHDNGSRKLPITWAVLVVTTTIVLSILLSGTVVMGSNDLSVLAPQTVEEEVEGLDLAKMTNVTETKLESYSLTTGQTETITLTSSFDNGTIIKGIAVRVTWTDEDDMRRFGRTYTNQPDSFNLVISSMNETATAEGANSHGEQGEIMASLNIPDNKIIETNGNFNATIMVTLTEAGMFSPRIGLIGFTDTGNACDVEMTVTYLKPPA